MEKKETSGEAVRELSLRPVGVVRSSIKTPGLLAGLSGLSPGEKIARARARLREIRESSAELHILPEYGELLDGIEGFSHIMVLYWPHLLDREGLKPTKVRPMGREDMPLTGIFATRSPARPNPILVSVVPLLERSGNVLIVNDLEAVDGSPLLDIKPQGRFYGGEEKPRVPEWMERLHRDLEDR